MKQWLQTLTQKLSSSRMRACILLEGDDSWHLEFCQNYLQQIPLASGFWVGKNSPFVQAKDLSIQQAIHQLGQETDFVIFSATQGIDPNTIGILSGMIKAGGLCIICLPNHNTWLKQPNLACKKYLNYPYALKDCLKVFNAFVWHKLTHHAIYIKQGQKVADLEKWLLHPDINSFTASQKLPTQDQVNAIKKINRVAFGHRKRPLVMIADRGRGKSSVLGLASIELIKQGKQKIIFTATRKDQVKVALEQVELAGFSHAVKFIAPDELLANPITTDVLMVDEAAHLPLAMLKEILHKYHRVVFSSTQHGYEGTGRSFKIKFTAILDTLTPSWKIIELNTPIRWQEKDWLEKTINKTLLLKQPDAIKKNSQNNIEIEYKKTTIEELLNTPEKLEQLFHLLVSAHYQTSPNDLMQLLESPSLIIFTAIQADQIIGVVIASHEGELPLAINRVQGHLFSQLLYKQTFNPEWLALRGLRIMRIAVVDELQNKIIGSNLLSQLEIYAKQNKIDYLSSSFGVTCELIGFWHKNTYQVCGIGVKQDKSSGSHSIQFSKPLTIEAKNLITQTEQQFTKQFSFTLMSEFKAIDFNILLCLLSLLEYPKVKFPLGYLYNQPYENLSFALRNWFLYQSDFIKNQENKGFQKLCVQKIIQNKNWQELTYTSTVNSRKQFEKQLRDSLRT